MAKENAAVQRARLPDAKPRNPFTLVRAEAFNHSYSVLAELMHFGPRAQALLGNDNVIVEGSRGSGKSMYLRLLSLPAFLEHQRLSGSGQIEAIPAHTAFVGVYAKLWPTIFGPHEFERERNFSQAFQQLFNVYCGEHMVAALNSAAASDLLQVSGREKEALLEGFSRLLLPNRPVPKDLMQLESALTDERSDLRLGLNRLPYEVDRRSQPEHLWRVARLLSDTDLFRGQRVYLLVDEYDSLSEFEQSVLNQYLQIRDAPLTLKVACKKHRLSLQTLGGRTITDPDDFVRLELDDDHDQPTRASREHLEAIANLRLRRSGFALTIGELLGHSATRHKPKVERKYEGFEEVALLSSGIARTFLEVCRDIYDRWEYAPESLPIPRETQHAAVESQASHLWRRLAGDQGDKHEGDPMPLPELPLLIERIATLFRHRSELSSEPKIIRLEIVDYYERTPTFLRTLLEQALELSALLQPNRERLAKNKALPSRGYILHRLLCVHFRLPPESRWDVEISSEQLQRLLLEGDQGLKEVLESPARRTKTGDSRTARTSTPTLLGAICPIRSELCPVDAPTPGRGFLAIRLPSQGKIRTAAELLQRAFADLNGATRYELRTAEDYEPIGDIACKVCGAVSTSDFVLAELSRLSPSVTMELGLALARVKPTYILTNREEQPELPPPFDSLEYVPYDLTTDSTRGIAQRIVTWLESKNDTKRATLGPTRVSPFEEATGVFVALPDTTFYRETVLPRLTQLIEDRGLGPVRTPLHGEALQALQKAALNIEASRYALIDTTHGLPVNALFFGLAQGYRRPFANLIDAEVEQQQPVFTDMRSKAEVRYRGMPDLLKRVADFLDARSR